MKSLKKRMMAGMLVAGLWVGNACGQEAVSSKAFGTTAFAVPAGGVAAVSVPYANPQSGDGLFRFGETGLAEGLPTGSWVYFWDVGKQKWGGGMKSPFGWDPAESNRVLAVGEGFCVRNGGGTSVVVTVTGEVPLDYSLLMTVPSASWANVAYPYPAIVRFGDSGAAADFPQGSSVMFWNSDSQEWSTYSKTAKGWSSAALNRVLAEGEAFFLRNNCDVEIGWVVANPDP